MLFNCDLLNVIAEVEYGFTVPETMLDTVFYRHLSRSKSHKQHHFNSINEIFNAIDMDDEIFTEHTYQSARTARWALHIIETYDIKGYLSGSRCIRLSIAANDMPKLIAILNKPYFDYEVLYAYATVEQLRMIQHMLVVQPYMVSACIARLDVMKFLYEIKPEAFAPTETDYDRTTILKYTGYGTRSVKVIEWLVDNGIRKFSSYDLKSKLSIARIIKSYDDSMIKWVLKHHTDAVIRDYEGFYKTENCKYNLFIKMLQTCNADTIELFYEKINKKSITVMFNAKMIGNMRVVYSLMQRDGLV